MVHVSDDLVETALRRKDSFRSRAQELPALILFRYSYTVGMGLGVALPLNARQNSSLRPNGVLLLAISGCAVSHAEMALDNPALLDAILCLPFHW
jgi:hypothetical protein